MYTRLSTVVTPASNRRLASLDLFKSGPTKKDNADDEYLDFLRDVNSQAFEGACNRVFATEGIRDVFRFKHGHYQHGQHQHADSLVLTRRPIVQITSVTDFNGTLDPSLYEVDREAGTLSRLWDCGDGTFSPIPWCSRSVTVEYTAGYNLPDDTGLTTLPADIQDAVITLMRMAWKGKDRDPALRSQSDGGIGTQSFWLGYPPNVQQAIAKYSDIPTGM